MLKPIVALACLGLMLLVGCSKPPQENPNARLSGPSQSQMQNTYSTTAKTKGGGGAMSPMMGSGAPYGNRMGSGSPYGQGSSGAPPPGMMGR